MIKTHGVHGPKSTIFAFPTSKIEMARTVPPTLTTMSVMKMLNSISIDQRATTMDKLLDWTVHNVDVPQIQEISTIFPGTNKSLTLAKH